MILKSRYCILEQLAGGGEGRVYLARDMELGTLWAVKEISIERKKEAKLLRLLEHPSMPKMVDYLEKGEYCYLIMEYIRGNSIKQCISQGRDFSVEKITEMGIETAGILRYLHSRKPPVYYGDLKPDNLMLSGDGRIYLVDFGSAVFGYTDAPGICMGTRGYAAPEQYEGRVGKTSDVYAFGKTFWEILGRKRLITFLRCPRLVFVLLKCSRKSEKYRYQDMDKVENALHSVLKELRRGSSRIWYGVTGGVLALALGSGLLFQPEKGMDFRKDFSKVTALYYEDDFSGGGAEEQKEVCRKAEKQLLELLRRYRNSEVEGRILLALALNAEYAGDKEQAELYYGQLLLFEPENREIYGEYGMFLWETGQKKESAELLEKYALLEAEGKFGEKESRNETIWEARINEWKEKEREAEIQEAD